MAVNADDLPVYNKPVNVNDLPDFNPEAPPPPISVEMLPTMESSDETLDTDAPGFLTNLQAAGAMPFGYDDEVVSPPGTISEADKRQALKDSTNFLRDNLRLANIAFSVMSDIDGDPSRELKQISAVTEEMTRIPSALMEQIGVFGGTLLALDREDNTMINLSRVLRDASRSPEFNDRDYFDELFQGLIQTGTFAFGGKGIANVLKQGNKAAGAIAAWLGAAVGGQAGREDAERFGSSPEQVEVAYWANSFFGLSEGLPIGIMFGKIDDVTGGIISKKLAGKAGQIVSGGIQGLLVESLQEGFQTFGENYTAKELASYDPSRSLGENIMESASIGGSVGLLMGLGATALGIRRRTMFQAEIKEKVLDPIGAKSLDEIASGEFNTLSEDYFNLIQEVGVINARRIEEGRLDQNLKQEFKTEVETARAKVQGRTGGIDTQPMTDRELQRFNRERQLTDIDPNFPAPTSADQIQGANDAQNTTRFMDRMQLNEELEGPNQTVPERVRKTPVTLAMTIKKVEADHLVPQFDKEISRIEDSIKGYQNAKIDNKRLILNLQTEVEGMKKSRNELLSQVKIEQAVAKDLKSLAAKLVRFLPKGSKLLIDDYTLALDTANTGKELGAAYRWKIDQTNSDGVGVITLSLDKLFKAQWDLDQAKTQTGTGSLQIIANRKQVLNNIKAEVIGTFMHEFGHQTGYLLFANLQRKVAMGLASENEVAMWQGISNDYLRYVSDNINAPSEQAMAQMFSMSRFQSWIRNRLTNSEHLLPTKMMEQLGKRRRSLTEMNIPDVSLPRTIPRMINYLFSIDEYFAEEFSKYAQNFKVGDSHKLEFFGHAVSQINKGLAAVPGKFRNTSGALNDYWRLHSIRGQMKAAQQEVETNPGLETNPMLAVVKSGIVDMDTMKRALNDADVFNKFMDIGFNILQIAQLNPHVQGLQEYVKTMRSWKNDVNTTLAKAEHRLTQWKNLGKKENETLGQLMLMETVGKLPEGGWLKTPRDFTAEEIATFKLSDEALQIFKDVKQDFRESLARMRDILITAKQKIFEADPIRETAEVQKVMKEFLGLMKRPYFPLMRFGEYTMEVRSQGAQKFEGRDYKNGEIIEFQAFDTKRERDRALSQSKREFGRAKYTFSSSKMVQPNFSVQGMPLTMIDHLESRLGPTMTDEQKGILARAKADVLPFRSFRKQFQRRRKVFGFSLDAQRAYANYMTSFANHVARVEFDQQFKDNLDSVGASIKAINRRDGGDSTKRSEILDHMNQHLEYVMNPVNEFVGLRSAAFFWFLGFNVKSAFVNLTQIPLVTYPYLAARYGDAKAVASLVRANGTAVKAYTNPKAVDAGIMSMIEQGLNESWLDESLATELALAASEKNLDKSLPRKARQKAVQKISHYGAYAFHVAEKFNRHVSAIATYRLAVSDGKVHEEAVEAARQSVEKTQFEYARWARPKFQRGKLGGTVFVFQNYMQNALFFALGGDPGAFRMLVMLFMMGGLMGLPFGENLADMIDAAMSALKKKTGMKDPLTQTRVDLREILNDINVDPDLVLHGLSSSTFGLANVGEFMGWPIPDIDLSGSLSMGRIIPGTEMIQPGKENTFERVLAGGTERAGGAIVSGISGIARAMFDTNPDQWKRWEKAMPAAMRQISKAARFQQRGEEATRSGYPIAGFDMHDTRDQGEIIAQGLGFTPRDVSKGWEGFIAEQQAITYYETWKSSLLRQWNYAKEKSDNEAVKIANMDIRRYNKQVPFPEMKIGFETRSASYNAYIRTRQLNSKQIEQSEKNRRLSSSIQKIFEGGESNPRN